MYRGKIPLACFVLWLSVVVPAWGQVYNTTDYVRNTFRKYLNREPTATELSQWVWSLQKGLPADQMQETFLASDEFFNRHQRNPNSFISGLFAEVLSRSPSISESSEWMRYYNQVLGDRSRFVHDFMVSASRELRQKPAIPNPPSGGVGSQPSVDRLVGTADQLSRSLQAELGGTYDGQKAIVMGRNLLAVSQGLQRAFAASSGYQSAVSSVRLALTALQAEMVGKQYAAPNSNWYLTKFGREFTGVVSLVPGPGLPLPEPPPAGLVPNLQAQLLTTTTALLGGIQQTSYAIRTVGIHNAYYDGLARDVGFFDSQVIAFQNLVRQNGSLLQMKSSFSRLRSLASGISNSVRYGNPAGSVSFSWNATVQQLQRLGRLLNMSGGPSIDPGCPVLFNSPTFHHLPYELQPIVASSASVNATRVIDEAIGQVDAFIAGFTPLVAYSPQIPSLQASARSLRNALAQLRQEVSWSTSVMRIQPTLNQVNRQLDALKLAWRQTVTGSQLRNVPNVDGISRSIAKLNELFVAGVPFGMRDRTPLQRNPLSRLPIASQVVSF